MSEPTPILSAGEQRFEEARRRAGFFLAPIVFLILWFLPIEGLTPEAHRLLAILGLVVTLWISEAIPLPVTALLGPTLVVVLGIGTATEVFRNFANPIIFLFLGSFLIAEAMFHHGLNRRIAFRILGLKAVGENPARLLLAFGCITAFLSMWISNTASAAMMFPIGVSILGEMARRRSEGTGAPANFTQLKFGTGLMLLTAFAASLGGLATPIGTPPNLIGIGMIEAQLGIRIPFFQWMQVGLPVAVVLVAFLIVYLNRVCPADAAQMRGSSEWIGAENAKLGRLSRGEKNVLAAFGVTVSLWLFPGVLALVAGTDSAAYEWFNRHFPEAMVALIGATLLFLLPVNFREHQFTLTWREARRIDWGTILLFGGGLALGDQMIATGLAKWIGTEIAATLNVNTTLGLIILFTVVASLVSETTSNSASAAMLIPVSIAVAQAAGVNPLQPALAATLGASMGFMLPVSTPPNAIVYGSGCVPLMRMVKHGFILDIVGAIAVIATVTWLVPIVFELQR